MYPPHKLTGLCICAAGTALLVAAAAGIAVGLEDFYMLLVALVGAVTTLLGVAYQLVHPRRAARKRIRQP